MKTKNKSVKKAAKKIGVAKKKAAPKRSSAPLMIEEPEDLHEIFTAPEDPVIDLTHEDFEDPSRPIIAEPQLIFNNKPEDLRNLDHLDDLVRALEPVTEAYHKRVVQLGKKYGVVLSETVHFHVHTES